VIGHQLVDHGVSGGGTRLFADGRQFFEFRKTPGRLGAERANSFGNLIDRLSEFGVLYLKQRMQRFELRPYDVPMEPLRFKIDYVTVGKQSAERSFARWRRKPRSAAPH
jgi:hypothetical protein